MKVKKRWMRTKQERKQRKGPIGRTCMRACVRGCFRYLVLISEDLVKETLNEDKKGVQSELHGQGREEDSL